MTLEVYRLSKKDLSTLPIYSSQVSAGFPSPADDYLEGDLDLNTHLIRNKAATFIVRASGQSMTQAGIFDQDLLLVDRSLSAKSGHIVIACIQGELLVKRLNIQNRCTRLLAENPTYPPIVVKESDDFSVWGVVTMVIHPLL